MRLKELKESWLQGSSIPSWKYYIKNILLAPSLSLGEMGERGRNLKLTQPSIQAIKQISNYLEKNIPSRSYIKTIEETPIQFTDGTEALIKQIYKAPDIKSSSQSETDLSPIKEKKFWNDGEVAETFLGAALYARFQSLRNVTTEEILDIMRNNKKFSIMENGFIGTAKRKNLPVDIIAVNKLQNNQVIVDYIFKRDELAAKYPKGVKELTKTLDACTAYVNESFKIEAALNQADTIKNAKKISVKTDGISDQRGTKADLQINVGKTLRLLSLKANDVKQFGQISGATGEIISKFFGSFIPNVNITSLYKSGDKNKTWPEYKNGWPDMSVLGRRTLRENGQFDEAVDQVYKLTGEAYKIAEKKIKEDLKNDPNTVIANLYKGIVQHANGNSTGQTLVILNPSTKVAWKELEFGKSLEKALKSFNIEVSLTLAGLNGEQNHILRVYGKAKDLKAAVAMKNDINSDSDARKAKNKIKEIDPRLVGTAHPEMLFQLRSYLQNHDT